MKKTKIFSLILSIILILSFSSCKPQEENPDTSLDNADETQISVATEEVEVSEIAGYEAQTSENSQIGIIVDSWLKVISIGERDGALSVLVRNTADFDVQYAVLSVVCDSKTLKFPMATLTAGSNAVLTCETDVKFEKEAQYYSWKISDKVIFEEKLSLYPEIFEIEGADGILSVKNISGKNIDGKIYVYYKTVTDGIYAEGTTYRICIEGLKKGEKIQISAEHFKRDTSKVMFVTYVQ